MDFGEGNDLAEIDLTYSPLRGISRARRVLGRPIVCIIQVNMTPLLANLSTCGVSISVSPYEEKLGDMSSMIIQSMFGRDESAALRCNPESIAAARTR